MQMSPAFALSHANERRTLIGSFADRRHPIEPIRNEILKTKATKDERNRLKQHTHTHKNRTTQRKKINFDFFLCVCVCVCVCSGARFCESEQDGGRKEEEEKRGSPRTSSGQFPVVSTLSSRQFGRSIRPTQFGRHSTCRFPFSFTRPRACVTKKNQDEKPSKTR